MQEPAIVFAPPGIGDSDVAAWVDRHKLPEPTFVTQPAMPDLQDYVRKVAGIWQSHQLTNLGPLHQELEARLCAFLGVKHMSLFCNGTTALLVALEALDIHDGEVITTPFTFPATVHALRWSHITPVFCDIDPVSLNLDPRALEPLIGPRTKAILGVHVYGRPCAVESIGRIAGQHDLRVIFDAAHAFGVRYKGQSILRYGDLSMASFHATKVFTTAEGGALVCHSEALRQRIELLKNFGIGDEESTIGLGINGKMNEFQAAFGLLQLEMVEPEIAARRRLAIHYREQLQAITGIRALDELADTEDNYAYFPILVDAGAYGLTRDQLAALLGRCNVMARKYFYPLLSRAACYATLPSAAPAHLPVAERVASRILCLPIYGALPPESVSAICNAIREAPELSHG